MTSSRWAWQYQLVAKKFQGSFYKKHPLDFCIYSAYLKVTVFSGPEKIRSHVLAAQSQYPFILQNHFWQVWKKSQYIQNLNSCPRWISRGRVKSHVVTFFPFPKIYRNLRDKIKCKSRGHVLFDLFSIFFSILRNRLYASQISHGN